MAALLLAASAALVVREQLGLDGLALERAAPFSVQGDGRQLAYLGPCKAGLGGGAAVDRGVRLPPGTRAPGVDVREELAFDGRKQWLLLLDDDLARFPPAALSDCGGRRGVGGFCVDNARGFNLTVALPPHALLRLAFSLSLLDFWQGQTFFVAALAEGEVAQYLYTESADTKEVVGGVDACGAAFKDPVVGKGVDVVFEWPQPQLRLHFGSTLEDDACLVSFFVAGIQLYVI